MKNLQGEMEKTKSQKEKINAALKAARVTASSGAGLVEVTLDGTGGVQNIDISESILSRDNKTMLETLIASAFSEALRKVDIKKEEEARKAVSELFGGMTK